MNGVKYIGPFFDGSGYAEAARNYVLAIYKKGYPITITPVSFENTRPDLGKDGEILRSLVNLPISYDKIVTHITPDLWAHVLTQENSVYKIGYTVWETSKIPSVWAQACNRVNEVWLPCDWNMEVFKESGVTRPLYKIPHAIEVPDLESVQDFNLEGVAPDTFVFYSIFQWQERKNPYGLLSSYMAAFTGRDDVILVLKTYLNNQDGDKEGIRKFILDFRGFFALDHYPKLFLVVANMSNEDMLSLHKRGDCFVLLQRSEGWGLPHFEAAACGKPVITTGYGGQTEFLKEDNSYLLDYQLTPVSGMPWSPYYRGDQFWADVNAKQAIETMRHVYENRNEAKEKGARARAYIQTHFTRDKVGDMLIDRLTKIDQGDRHV